jgi:hypothetical protein
VPGCKQHNHVAPRPPQRKRSKYLVARTPRPARWRRAKTRSLVPAGAVLTAHERSSLWHSLICGRCCEATAGHASMHVNAGCSIGLEQVKLSAARQISNASALRSRMDVACLSTRLSGGQFPKLWFLSLKSLTAPSNAPRSLQCDTTRPGSDAPLAISSLRSAYARPRR